MSPRVRVAALGVAMFAAACAAPADRAADTATAAPDGGAAGGPTSARAWTIAEDEAGPLRIGMTAAEVGRALGAALQPTYEPGGQCAMLPAPGAPDGVSLMFVADTLVRVDVEERDVRTAGGVGVGSDEAAVQAAYGARVQTTPHKYDDPPAHYLTVPAVADSAHAFVFETDGVRVTRYRAGRRPEVELVEGCS